MPVYDTVYALDQGGNVVLVWPDTPGEIASPLTTKGDLWGYGSSNTRVPVGSNGQLLIADSTQPLGLRWSGAPAGSVLIGTGSSFSPATLTAGANITIMNSPGGITIAGSAAYTLPDATTITTGGVEVAVAPSGSHPVVLVTEQLGVAGGLATLDVHQHAQQQAVADGVEAATNDVLGSSSTIISNLNRIRYQLAQLGTGAWDTLRAMVQLSPSGQQTGTINVSGQVQGGDFKSGGLAGATAPTRYVGGTTSGAPTAGTFAVGDFVVADAGELWVCTSAGTPGTWTEIGLDLEYDSVVSALPDPTDFPTLVATTPGTPTSLGAGTYHVGYCWTTSQGGRTKLSKTSSITITAGQGIQATAPALPSGASGVEFYIDDCAPPGVGNGASGSGTYGALASGGASGSGTYGALTSGSASGSGTYGALASQGAQGGGTS